MKIKDKIEDKRHFFLDDMEARKPDSDALQTQIAEAIRDGRGSKSWRRVMRNFADNPAQLARLTGEDDLVDTVWGENVLAYIIANGMCTMGSTFNTFLNMDADMIESLDRDLSDDVEAIPADPDDPDEHS